MRYLIIAPALLAVAGCSAADNSAQEAGNIAETAGEAIVGAAEDAGAAVANGIDDLGNTVSNAATANAASWVGRWTGVEGTYLVVSKDPAGDDRYELEMQYTLDDKGVFDGTATAQGIRFTRPDGEHILRATDGDATGLKWLAGKQDCLTVADGEGYCRD